VTPHPFVGLGGFAVLFQHLYPGFISLQVVTAVLNLPHQVDQGFEHVFQPDDPMGHVGTADLMSQALEHFFQAIQWQPIGVFGGNDVRQQ